VSLLGGFIIFGYRLGTDINRREFQKHFSTLLVYTYHIQSKSLWVSCSQTTLPLPRVGGGFKILSQWLRNFQGIPPQRSKYIKPQACARESYSYEVIIPEPIGQAKRNDRLHVKIYDKSPHAPTFIRSTKHLMNNYFCFIFSRTTDHKWLYFVWEGELRIDSDHP
jgi:hypothetical protein